MNPVLIVGVVIVVIALCLPLAWYNKLVRLRQLIKEAGGMSMCNFAVDTI